MKTNTKTHLGILGGHGDPSCQHDENGIDVPSLCSQVQRCLPVGIAVVAVRPRLRTEKRE